MGKRNKRKKVRNRRERVAAAEIKVCCYCDAAGLRIGTGGKCNHRKVKPVRGRLVHAPVLDDAAYMVVCDETTNSPETMAKGEVRGRVIFGVDPATGPDRTGIVVASRDGKILRHREFVVEGTRTGRIRHEDTVEG